MRPSFFLAVPPRASGRGALEAPPIYPPLGILYLGAALREKFPSAEITVSDGLFEGPDKCMSRAKSANPDIIGVSFQSLYSGDAFMFAENLRKEFPDASLIAGGAHPTFFPEDCLKHFDFAVIGEAEETFCELSAELLKANGDFRKVRGIAYGEKGQRLRRTLPREQIKDISRLPFPARDLMPGYKKYPGFFYQKRRPDTSIISSRGCPYKCTFCSKTWGDLQRARSPESVADELEMLEGDGVREVYDWTDEFNLVPKNSAKVLSEIRGRKLDLSLKGHFRANGITKEYAGSLSKTGFWLANVGIESANERTLLGIKKGVTIPIVRKALSNLKAAGVKTLGFFMGFSVWTEPDGKGGSSLVWEGAKETENTLKLIDSLIKEGLLDYFTFSLPTPYPGSELFNQAKEHGLLPEAPDFSSMTSHQLTMRFPGATDAEILLVKKKAQLLQAKAILKAGDFNRGLWKFYFSKIMSGISPNMKDK